MKNAAALAAPFFIVAGKLWRIQQTCNINNLTCLRFIEMVVIRMVAFKLGVVGRNEKWQKVSEKMSREAGRAIFAININHCFIS